MDAEESTSALFIWTLDKYARYIGKNPPDNARSHQGDATDGGMWKLHESSTADLKLSITNSCHLILTLGSEIQENHLLWNAQSWMRGVCKGDSMLIICKIKGESRKFRVKFRSDGQQSGQQCCDTCFGALSKYCSMRKLSLDTPSNTQRSSSQDGDEGCPTDQRLDGSVSLGKLTQVLSGELAAGLPLAYQNSNLPTDQLGAFIRLCLSDSNFPAFVGAVEAEMEKVTSSLK